MRCCFVAGSATMSPIAFVCCPKSWTFFALTVVVAYPTVLRTMGCRCSVVVPMVRRKLCSAVRGRI